MSEGYIKLYRQLKNNFLWKSEKFTKAQAWIDILLSANHKDGGFEVRGIWVEVKRGQVARSELTMAEEWKWSREKVRRFLDRLVDAEMLRIKRDNKTTLLTIVNYDMYQGCDTTNETPNLTPEKHQKNTKRDTNNNVKNEKNVNNYSDAFERWWKIYPERNGRKAGKKTAFTHFKKIPETEWKNLKIATDNYSKECNGLPKDAERFLKNDFWKDFVTKAVQNNESGSSRAILKALETESKFND